MRKRSLLRLLVFWGVLGGMLAGTIHPAVAQPFRDWLEMLEEFWLENYDVFGDLFCNEPFATYDREVLAKGQPDECFFDVGDHGNLYDPQYGNIPVVCTESDPKVNHAYVWGLTKCGDDLWFGTIANTPAIVIGSMLSGFEIDLEPIMTDSWVAEFGESEFSPPLQPALGDWRSPRIFVYDTQTSVLTEKTPDDVLLGSTSGIRSAGALVTL